MNQDFIARMMASESLKIPHDSKDQVIKMAQLTYSMSKSGDVTTYTIESLEKYPFIVVQFLAVVDGESSYSNVVLCSGNTDNAYKCIQTPFVSSTHLCNYWFTYNFYGTNVLNVKYPTKQILTSLTDASTEIGNPVCTISNMYGLSIESNQTK